MELIIELVFGFAVLAGVMFTYSVIYLLRAIHEFNKLFKQYQ